MTVAALHAVTKRFGATVALDALTLHVQGGEIVALLGPNGAGKTTAFALLLGLRKPDDGHAELFGRDPRRPDARKRVGTSLQEPAFPLGLRTREVVDLVRAHYRDPPSTHELLHRFGLGRHERMQVGALSPGWRRRLALAAAFAGRPSLVVLDEPTAGLDVDGRRAVWDILGEFSARGGTVLLSTHHLEEADAVATRIVVLAAGRKVADGSPSALKANAGLDGEGCLEDAVVALTKGSR